MNTWMGDPVRMTLLECIVEAVEEDNLLERTQKAGNEMMNQLYELEVKKGFQSNQEDSKSGGKFLKFEIFAQLKHLSERCFNRAKRSKFRIFVLLNDI